MKTRRWIFAVLAAALCLCLQTGALAEDLFTSGGEVQEAPAQALEGSVAEASMPDMDALTTDSPADQAGLYAAGEPAADQTGLYEAGEPAADQEGPAEADEFVEAEDAAGFVEAADPMEAEAVLAVGEAAEEAVLFDDGEGEDADPTAMVADSPMSGECGSNVHWALTPLGDTIPLRNDEEDPDYETAYRLTLSGSGPMDDYDWEDGTVLPPWEPWDIFITEVVFAPGSSITHIGDWAFYHFAYVDSIVFPNSVKSIGVGAVTDCRSNVWDRFEDQDRGLQSVTIPRSVTSIGRNAFAGNAHLTTVNWDGTWRELGAVCYKEEGWNDVNGLCNAFWGASFIDEYELAPGQEFTWDASNFPYVGTSFLDFKDIGISSDGWYLVTVHSTGKTFTEVTLLTEAEDPEDNNEEHLRREGIRTNQNGEILSDTYFFPVKVPSGSEGKKLGVHVVTRDDELSKSLTVSYTVQPWEKGLVVMEGAYGQGVTWQLKVLEPEGITGYDPNHDDSWDGHWTEPSLALSFTGSGAMHDLAFSFDKPHEDPSQEHPPWRPFQHMILEGSVGKGITHIGDFAFAWIGALREVSIPDSVTSIGHHAFAWCQSGEGDGENFHATDGLKTITIPASVTSIGEGAFLGQIIETVNYGNESIVSFASRLPREWGNFYYERLRRLFDKGSPASNKYCEPVKGAVVLDGSCGENVRFEATLLDDKGEQRYNPNHDENWDGYWTWYPVQLKLTGSGAMKDYYVDFSIPREDPSIIDPPWSYICDNVTKLSIGKGITHIGEYAFIGFRYLTEVTIPEGVVSIGRMAFKDCNRWPENNQGNSEPVSSIKTLTLPKSLKFIGKQAFNGNRWLETVNYPGTLGELAKLCEKVEETDPPIAGLANVFPPMSPWAAETYRPVQMRPGQDAVLYTRQTDLAKNGLFEFRLSDMGLPSGTYRFTVTLTGNGGIRLLRPIYNQNGNVTDEEWLSSARIEARNSAYKPAEVEGKLDADTVYALLIWTDEVQDSDKVTASFTMNSDAGTMLSSCTMTLSYTSKTYTGKALKPKVTLKNGSKTVPSSAYTVSYKNNKNAGTATVTATAKSGSGYAGTQTAQFTIKKAKSLTLPKTAYTKTALAKAQSFSLGASAQGKLTYTSSDKTGATVSSAGKVTIKKNFSGIVTITVKAAATTNYRAESKTVKITVRPAAVKLRSAASSAAKKAVVRWTKNAYADGYQLQYATSKDFKTGCKTKKITKASTVSATLTGLTSKKTWYIRIRTYKTSGGTNCYSKWSDVRTVVVK